ncbi:MAG TPA: hypothetical protein VN612_04610 [Acidobacteriaceae bacterium]|nr:hypothetical protein [Acidobacteriaceae bacterium]
MSTGIGGFLHINNSRFGVIVEYKSTVRPCTVISADRDARGDYWVVIRTAGVTTYATERLCDEVTARKRFEKIVERHIKGLPPDEFAGTTFDAAGFPTTTRQENEQHDPLR